MLLARSPDIVRRTHIFAFLCFSLLVRLSEGVNILVEPSFLLVEENWNLDNPLPVVICPPNVKIISGDTNDFFAVVKLNDSCAALKLNQPLDADKENADGSRGQSFSLVLVGPKKAQATLDVQVVDVNDNAPVFFNTPSTHTVSENAGVGEQLLRIRTRDPDTGISGNARFTIDNDKFSLDKRRCGNGVCSTALRLAKKLDFEKTKVEQVIITARDGDPHTNRTNEVSHAISILVTDEQDEPPIFQTDFSAPVVVGSDTKLNDVIVKVSAVDGDEFAANKNAIRYSIAPNAFLGIDASSGDVFLKKVPLPSQELSVNITATENDTVGMSSTAELKIRPTDGTTVGSQVQAKVQREVCEFPIYEAKLVNGQGRFEENVIIQLLDDDKEQTPQLIGGLDTFGLTPRGNNSLELIIVDKIRVAEQNLNNAQLLVKTATGQCRITLTTVDAVVVAPEPSRPKFESDSFLFYVTENHRPTVLGTVKVTGGDNVTFSVLGDGADKFAVSKGGEIRSLAPIDREVFDKFALSIRATNSLGESTDAPCTIVVRDINDNSPTFDKDVYYVSVDEGKSLKQKLTATDPDLGPNGQIEYSIDEPHESLPVDVTNGILFIGALDKDTMESGDVNLTLRATDKGVPPRSSTTKLIIKVKDLNDNWPVFSNSRYSIVLDANISPGGVLGSVRAEDADSTSPNNYIRYSSQDPKFKITDEGDLIFTGPGVLSKETFVEFVVTATDGGTPQHKSTAVVAVNEHKSAMKSELTAQLNSNDTQSRTEIPWANAGMSGYNYEIIRATSKGFPEKEVKQWIAIDKSSGRIESLRRIDPDLVKEIRLYISMTKGKREVPVELIINVVDTDEVAPLFNTTVYATSISEATTVGTTVLVVKASNANVADGLKPVFKNGSVFTISVDESSVLGTVLELPYPLAVDADSGKFAQLRYSMTGDEGFFKIDPANSTIRLVASLDYESQRTHSLTVRCIDNDGREPHHEVFATVTVHVVDVNDNEPVIHNGDLTHLNIGEDAPLGTVITALTVTDADEGNKQAVDINANHTLFRVDDEKKLVVAEKLHGYAGQRICSSITVTDTGKPPKLVTSPYCVTVYPAKNNHHNPLIVSPKQNSIHYFDENIVYGELLTIKVLDEGDDEKVTFKLDEQFKKDWQSFSVNSTGSLKAKGAFDFEKKTVHEIKVQACRQSNCTSIHLFISVNDRNDNCPMFPKQDVRLSVVENEKGQRQVGRIPAALDADFHADNTKVCYTTESPLFYFLDVTLPVLYTNSSFDRERVKSHHITITAYDCHLSCRDPHKSTNGSITGVVDVKDVNDNFPRFTQKIFRTTVIQGQATPGSHLLTVSATDADEEPDGLRYSIRGQVRGLKQAYAQSESPVSIDQKTGDISANELLKDWSLTFSVAVTDGVRHEDTATVVISVVTYAQQTELVFDAPFDLIVKNEKTIVEKLSNATGLLAVVDRCRQNSNFTLMLVHFVDRDGNFVNVDRATNLLMTAASESRRELRSVYGLREAFPPVALPSKAPQVLALGAIGLLIIVVLAACIWCRQRNSYEEKLRQISAQASAVHTITLGRPPHGLKKNPTYGEIHVPPSTLVAGRMCMAHPTPLPSLQSTEL